MPSYLTAITERLSFALESARQIAFEWSIPDDRLYFSGEPPEGLRGVLLDTSKLWSSRALPTIMHRDDRQTFRQHLYRALKGEGGGDGAFHQVELRLKDAMKTWCWVGINGKIVERDADGRAVRMVGTFSDIDERKRSEALQLAHNRILNMVATGAELSEILNAIARLAESQSERAICVIRQLHDDGPTITATDIHCQDQRAAALQHGLTACSSWHIEGKKRKVLGSLSLYLRDATAPSPAEVQLCALCAELAGIAIESRASEERIRYLAHYDGLTSLPNRFLFNEYLGLALRHAQRHESKFAVFFLDLDHFKAINDNFGHDAGDHVLREVANRLRGCLRHTDKIARMGGDEFYVLIEDLHDSRYAASVAQKLLDAASRPIQVGSHEHRLSVSIGIGIYPHDGLDGSTLLKNADAAMYRAKQAGKDAFQFYSNLNRAGGATILPFKQAQHAKANKTR